MAESTTNPERTDESLVNPIDPPTAAPPAKPIVAPAAKPARTPTEVAERDEVGDGGTLADIRMAFTRNTGWLGTVGGFIADLFHYFFIGCASLLGLVIVILVPLVVASAVAVLLGLPGYLAYRWFVTPNPEAGLMQYVTPLTVIVTIFWSGYFVTHGWPHLSEGLARVFGWIKPALVWMGRVLENISEDDDEEIA